MSKYGLIMSNYGYIMSSYGFSDKILGINHQFVLMFKPLPPLHKHQNGSFWF